MFIACSILGFDKFSANVMFIQSVVKYGNAKV